ncbi:MULTISPECIES: LysR substrate-binding domain-containing protein [Cupriavidus]
MKSTSGRHLPALSNLVALEATARLGSVTAAAGELCLTQSAVSKQLTELEAYLGVAMLARRKGAVTVTQTGEQYLRTVRRLVAELEEATLDVMAGRGQGGRLDVSVPVSLGNIWLLPRLLRFAKAHPHVQVNVTTKVGPVDLQASGLDAAIMYCAGPREGQFGIKLMPLALFPVCAPELLSASGATPQSAEATAGVLARLPLLHQTAALEAWPGYCAAAGLPVEGAMRGPRYALLTMGLQAALAGLGVALLPEYVAGEDLRAGRLVRLGETVYVSPRAYFFICLEEKRHSPVLRIFSDWLAAQVAGTADAPS